MVVAQQLIFNRDEEVAIMYCSQETKYTKARRYRRAFFVYRPHEKGDRIN